MAKTTTTPDKGTGKKMNELFERNSKEHETLLGQHRKHDTQGKKNHRIAFWIPFSISLLSLVFSVFSVFKVTILQEEETICIGMTPFHINDKNDLIDRYRWDLRPINNKLHGEAQGLFKNKKFMFDVSISNDYNDVLPSLQNSGDIQMAFVSHYLFYKYLNSPEQRQKVEHIGYKTLNGKYTYSSVFVWNRDEKIGRLANMDSIVNYIKADSKSRMLLGHQASVSSHIIPRIVLGQNNFEDEKKIQYVSRAEMINMLKDDSEGLLIGAMSNEDFDKLDAFDKSKFYTLTIYEDIPYDAVLVNKEWWCERNSKCKREKKRGLLTDKERKLILENMRYNAHDTLKYTKIIGLVDVSCKELYDTISTKSEAFLKYLCENRRFYEYNSN